MSIFGGETLHMWEEDFEESTVLVYRSSMWLSLRQETQMRNPFLPEALPPTRAMRGCNLTLFSTLWSQEDRLRARLL
jgi:hypothetical protein